MSPAAQSLPRRNPVLFYALLLLAAVPVFIADWYTPLGISVWILYLVPLVLTLLGPSAEAPIVGTVIATALVAITTYTDERLTTGVLQFINRLFGFVAIWSVGWLTRRLLVTRNTAQHEARLRGAQAELLKELQGELAMRELGARMLRVVMLETGAPAAAVYTSADEQVFQLAATRGVDAETVPAEVRRGDGLIGQAIESGQLQVIEDVPAAAFRMSTALSNGAPRHLAILPL
ncbi:MAG TPA: GAF domain-containing protein, partial [Luteitalea sp.]|nr:GAF domain-containing protein [Luteitalea sp.]